MLINWRDTGSGTASPSISFPERLVRRAEREGDGRWESCLWECTEEAEDAGGHLKHPPPVRWRVTECETYLRCVRFGAGNVVRERAQKYLLVFLQVEREQMILYSTTKRV